MTVDLQAIRAAHERIRKYIHRTPVLTCATLDRLCGARLYLKAENFQRGGAFKLRGATNAVLSLPQELAAKGVATHSSGNHAQALALAARARSLPAHIVMPQNSSRAKVAAVADYGGDITYCDATLEAREAALRDVVARTGATEIHPYDDDRIIAGAGTAALELIEDIDDLEIIIAPVGGGGLLSGTAIAARGVHPTLRIIGAEPELADDAFRSLRQGKRLPPRPPTTIADGLRTGLGVRNFEILQRLVERVLLAGEEEIVEAMRLLWERAKLVVEPSGAIGVAVALAHAKALGAGKIGIILSGGNVDLCRNELCNFWKPRR